MARNVKYIISLRDKFTRNLKGANASVKSMNKSTIGLSSTISRITPLLGGLSAALVLTGAAKTVIGFEKEMSNVKALTEATGGQFALLQKQAEDLGKSTVFSAKQAAEGMGFLAMAGFDVQKIYKSMPGLLDLAAAGEIDLGRAADIASNILTQFGLRAEELGRVNDVIAKTSSKSNTNIEQLAEALKYTGTTSKILGQSLEETSTAIGVLANAGLQGSIGGTSLNFALLEMNRASSPTAKALKKLGIQLTDSSGKFVGITSVIKQFEEKQISATKALDIFGARGGRAFGALLQAGSGALMELSSHITNAEGTAKRMADVKLDNLAGELTKLKSAAQGFAISMSKDASSSIRQAVKLLTKLITVLEKNRKAIKFIIKAFVIYKGAMLAYTLVTKRATIATKALSLVMKANPYALVATGLLLLISKLRSMRKSANEAAKAQAGLNVELEKTQFLTNLEAIQDFYKKAGIISKQGALQLIDVSKQGWEKYKHTVGNTEMAALESIRTAMEQNLEELRRKAEKEEAHFKEIGIKGTFSIARRSASLIERQLSIIDQELKKYGNLSPVSTIDASTRETKITSRSPKVINITIQKLIETQEINTPTLQQSTAQIKNFITKTVMEALNDTQIAQRAS